MKTIDELLELPNKIDEKAVKFRARIFGLFYEEMLEKWLERRSEKDWNVLKRDYRRGLYQGKRQAIDFIIKEENDILVAEAKSWPAYSNGYIKEINTNNLGRIKEATGSFLNDDFVENYLYIDDKGNEKRVKGKILIWWNYKKEQRKEIKDILGLYEIFSIKDMLNEEEKPWKDLVSDYYQWVKELFDLL